MYHKAYAKINLYLHITGRYENGYHKLDMIMCPIDVADDIRIIKSDLLEVCVHGDFASLLVNNPQDDNLVVKAVRLLEEYTGLDLPCLIDLKKNIPSGAGLGGGSSDAAKTLLLVRDLYELDDISDQDLKSLAFRLGADIPFFIEGGCAHVTGAGECMRSMRVPVLENFYVLLVFPMRGIETGKSYQAYARSGALFTSPLKSKSFLEEGGVSDRRMFLTCLSDMDNDLQEASIELVPEIDDILTCLAADARAQLVRMSGSGSVCFSLYESEKDAQHYASIVKQKRPQDWIRVCRFV